MCESFRCSFAAELNQQLSDITSALLERKEFSGIQLYNLRREACGLYTMRTFCAGKFSAFCNYSPGKSSMFGELFGKLFEKLMVIVLHTYTYHPNGTLPNQ